MIKYLNLKTLIITAVAFTFLLTIAISFYNSNRINTEVLIHNTLENNAVYAQKLASTTERFIDETFSSLSYSANYLSDKLDDDIILTQEAERLRTQSEMFNSVIISNKDGLVLGVSPPTLELKGQTLTTEGPIEALQKQTPLISAPYQSTTNRLVIFISYPIFDKVGQYLGFVGGAIYLKEDNVLHSLLGQHYYDDGSYVYVVDQEGRIIYHKDPERLDSIVLENEVVQNVITGKSGSQEVTNTQGVEMLAGYSPIAYANWGVVSQRPKAVTLTPIDAIQKKLLTNALPLFLVTLIVVLWFALKIARPINQMAFITAKNTKQDAASELNQISTWYYETKILKETLQDTLSTLHSEVSYFRKQSSTDALTGLLNRRMLDQQLQAFVDNETPFALFMLDIDYFKKVNDTYGHAIGDEVLKFLGLMMQKNAEEDMICYRYGGEEFAMLLPLRSQDEAYEFAQQLRQELAETISPCGYAITISGGIALYPQHSNDIVRVMELADQALYDAKQAGRNQIKKTII